jgi:hypothetical protein
LCGNSTTVTGDKLRNRGVSSCRSCAVKKVWETRREKILSKKEALLLEQVEKGNIKIPEDSNNILVPVITSEVVRAAIINKKDSVYINGLTWHFYGGYAVTRPTIVEKGDKPVSMHRLLAYKHGIVDKLHPGKGGTEVDHINRNKLDNRIENLRAVNAGEQAINKGKSSNNTSGYKGVYSVKGGKWVAKIGYRGKSVHLGTFNTKKEANEGYKKAVKTFFPQQENN